MVFLRVVIRSSVIVALATTVAQAQTARVIAAPRGQSRIAAIAPPPPPPSPFPNYQLGETIFGSVPAIITGDGRVLVNLGYGYEQVARTCPYAYGYGCQSYGYPMAPQTPIFGPYGPPNYMPPTYMPPAYGAPQYPAPAYPPSSYQPPRYNPPPTNPSGCPAGYVPTGTYPPCVDPARYPSAPLTVPERTGGPAATRRSGTASAAAQGSVVARRR
jgi:hypothetical protein